MRKTGMQLVREWLAINGVAVPEAASRAMAEVEETGVCPPQRKGEVHPGRDAALDQYLSSRDQLESAAGWLAYVAITWDDWAVASLFLPPSPRPGPYSPLGLPGRVPSMT
jgi:hypothetical protein